MRLPSVISVREPDLRSPGWLLFGFWRAQWRLQAVGALCEVVGTGAQVLVPAAIGAGVDAGLRGGDVAALVRWSGVVLALGLVSAGMVSVLRHRYSVLAFLDGCVAVTRLTIRAVVRLGGCLPRASSVSEIVGIGTSDVDRIGYLYAHVPRLIGSTVSAGVMVALVARISPVLGLITGLGFPLAVGGLVWLTRPLGRRKARLRVQVGRAAGLAADVVGGLRVLRGIGGERVFAARFDEASQDARAAAVHAGRFEAAIEGFQVLLPGAIVVAVVGVGAHLAAAGRISPGDLVAAYAFAAMLPLPLWAWADTLSAGAAALVAARRVRDLLATGRDLPEPVDPLGPPPPSAGLTDPRSGLSVPPRVFTAVACPVPEVATGLADRLGRWVDEPVGVAELAGLARLSGGVGPGGGPADPGGVRYGDVPLRRIAVADVRSRVLVADRDPLLLAGPLAETFDVPPPRGGTLGLAADLAVWAADAGDVTAMIDDSGGAVSERGRSLSGGQRQRLALARALVAASDVLILDEPTNAVDAHTEARIALRLREVRAGRTTVVMATSPLLLDAADHVVLLDEAGTSVVAAGRHRDLLRDDPRYRRFVTREESDDGEPDDGEVEIA